MVYLSKKEADKIVRELSKTKKEELREIVKKLKSSEKPRKYVHNYVEIRELLQKAFKEKRKIKIRYYSPNSDEHTTRIIDIYKMHLNVDAIIAYCHLRDDERTFAIERINSAAILDERYTIPKNWSPESIILDK